MDACVRIQPRVRVMASLRSTRAWFWNGQRSICWNAEVIHRIATGTHGKYTH